jgi:hypothetical protein
LRFKPNARREKQRRQSNRFRWALLRTTVYSPLNSAGTCLLTTQRTGKNTDSLFLTFVGLVGFYSAGHEHAEQCLYRGRVERQRPTCARSRSEKWSVYCEHKLPKSMAELLHNTGKIKEIFSIDAQAFSVAQNDDANRQSQMPLKGLRVRSFSSVILRASEPRSTIPIQAGMRPGAPWGNRSATLRDSA